MTRRIDWDKVKTLKDLKAIFEAWKLTFSSDNFDADFPGLLPYLLPEEDEGPENMPYREEK